MKTITVFKASPTVRKEPVPSIRLEINEDVETADMVAECKTSMSDIDHFFVVQADIVMEALKSLPQGTKHRLLIMMLQEHPSNYLG
jgi:hypothetical protein